MSCYSMLHLLKYPNSCIKVPSCFFKRVCVSQALDTFFVCLIAPRCAVLVSFTLLLQMLIDPLYLPVQRLHGSGNLPHYVRCRGFLNPQLNLLISLHIHVFCSKHLAFAKSKSKVVMFLIIVCYVLSILVAVALINQK